MNGQGMDPEDLAALLDGRLDERERADVLARLEASDEDYESFLDATALLAELDAEDEAAAPAMVATAPEPAPFVAGPAAPRIVPADAEAAAGRAAEPEPRTETPVIPLHRRPRPVWRRPAWMAAAAVIAAAALTPLLWTRGQPAGMGQVAERLSSPRAGLPPGWMDERPWGTTLGAGDGLSPEVRAVRLGATHVDLQVARAAGDTAAAALLALQAAALLDNVPGLGQVASTYRAISAAPSAPADLETLAGDAAALAGREYADLGAWAEAALLAARRQDARFLRDEGNGGAAERALRIPGLPADARTGITRLRTAMSRPAPDWPVIEKEAYTLLRVIGS